MISFIKDILDASKDFFIQRIKSPLISSFGFSWLIFNWKIVLIFFLSEKNIDEKITLIESYLNIYNSFAYPFLSAIFYTFIYPWINYRIFLIHRGMQKDTEMKKIEDANEVLEGKIKISNLQHKYQSGKYKYSYEIEKQKLNHELQIIREKLNHEESMRELDIKFAEKSGKSASDNGQ